MWLVILVVGLMCRFGFCVLIRGLRLRLALCGVLWLARRFCAGARLFVLCLLSSM